MSVKRRPQTPGNNLRKLDDRRADDLGPPSGWRERRRTVERRLPIIEEGTVSLREWHQHFLAFVAYRQSAAELLARQAVLDSLPEDEKASDDKAPD
jgi:hypothetical protein